MSDKESLRLHRSRKIREALCPYLFISPAYVCMVVLLLIPVLLSIYLSFTNATVLTMFDAKWVGLANYKTFFSSGTLKKVGTATLAFVLVTPFVAYAVGMYFALMMQRCRVLSPLFRGLIILPIAVSDVALVLVIRQMFGANYGLVNNILVSMGLTKFQDFTWFGKMPAALIVVLAISVWKNYPICFLMLFAGMKSIPKELYEAAAIDGATGMQQFRHVTLPGLRFVSASLLLLEIVWQINQFTLIWLLTSGGPANATSVLSIFSYRNAFEYDKLGYGAAIGFFTMVVALIIAAVYYVLVIRKMDTE